MTTISKSVYTEIDVDVDIELPDVLEFIREANESEIAEIQAELNSFDGGTVRHLINQANQFGLSDMLEQLKNEGVRVGAYLKPKVVL